MVLLHDVADEVVALVSRPPGEGLREAGPKVVAPAGRSDKQAPADDDAGSLLGVVAPAFMAGVGEALAAIAGGIGDGIARAASD